MCGVAGVLTFDGSSVEQLTDVVVAMALTPPRTAGPDAGTSWVDAPAGITSVIDASRCIGPHNLFFFFCTSTWLSPIVCEPAANGVAVADILRFLRYDEVYGNRRRARELYQALPPEARNLVAADLAAAQAACPHGLPVVESLRRAEEKMG